MRNPTVDDTSHDIPVSVPHTTAASTFVYGVNAVLAALSAKKRLPYEKLDQLVIDLLLGVR